MYEHKLMDRSAIEFLRQRTPAPIHHTVSDLLEWLDTPLHLRIPWTSGVQPRFDSPFPLGRGKRTHFRYATPLESGYELNDVVHGDAFTGAAGFEGRFAMITLHGATMDDKDSQHYLARRLISQGLDLFALELPYHMNRRPSRDVGSGDYFLSPDILRTVRAVEQAVADVCALAQGLVEKGYEKIFLLGISLGGLVAAHSMLRVHFSGVALLTPLVDPVYSVWEQLAGEAERRGAREAGFTEEMILEALDRIRPARDVPLLVSPDNLRCYLGEFDEICPVSRTKALLSAWGLQPTTVFPSGHMGLGEFYPEIREDFTEVFLREMQSSRRFISP